MADERPHRLVVDGDGIGAIWEPGLTVTLRAGDILLRLSSDKVFTGPIETHVKENRLDAVYKRDGGKARSA